MFRAAGTANGLQGKRRLVHAERLPDAPREADRMKMGILARR